MTSQEAKRLCQNLVQKEIQGRRLKRTTQASIMNAQNDFFSYLGKTNICAIGKKELRKYHGILCKIRSKKNGELLQGATVNDRFHGVKLLFSVLYRAGVITENPCAGLSLDLPKQQGVRRRPLTRDEITFFFEQFDIDDRQELKDRTLFELIYSSGLRVAEAAALKIEDVNLRRRTLIVRGKRDRDRMVPISIIARDMLTAYLGDRATDGTSWIFPGYKGSHLRTTSISERFRTLLRKYGMDKPELSTHSLRHSTATHLLENGASIRHVQTLLGHKSIESTVRYTHLQIDGLAKTHRKYHLREHNLFTAVDADYSKRLGLLL